MRIPEIAFALLNGAAETPAKAENGNVSSLLPNATQIGWIAGALAGLMTETGTIAFIGGMELDTTKGKGVSFMENQAGWHGKAPNDEEYAQAMAELAAARKAIEEG